MGARKKPSYRVVVADSRTARNGRFIEEIGYYNPLTDPVQIKVNEDKAIDWMKKGAVPTHTVKNLFNTLGISQNKKPEEQQSEAGVE